MKRVFNLIIVDESGSMSVIWNEALTGLNETLETVRKTQKLYPDMEQRVTLITFDSTHTRYIFDNQSAEKTHTLTEKDYRPGGATPLYDAIGQGVSKMNAQVDKDDSVLVTIITDGEENCSREYNLEMVKRLIEKLKEQDWTFTLIGTENLDVEGMAAAMSIDDHMAFQEDAAGTAKMFAAERVARSAYYADRASGAAPKKGGFFRRKNK